MLNSNLGNPFIFWILRILLLLVLSYCGYRISKIANLDGNGSKIYWRYGLFSLITYSLIEGLRWNRGWDYYHYYQDLTGEICVEYREILYVWWTYFFKMTSLPYWAGFIFYSAILFYSFLLLLKQYHKSALLAMPLFLIIPNQSENLIRMFFAMAFLLMGVSSLLKNSKKLSLFFFLATILIHQSALITVFLILFFYFINFKYDNKVLLLIIVSYFLIYFMWDISNMDVVAQYLSLIDIGDYSQGQVYFDNADVWFSSEGDISVKYGWKGGILSTTLNSVVPIYLLIYGLKTLKYEPRIKLLLCCMLFAFFEKIVFGNIELFSRYYHWMTCIIPITIGVIFYAYPFKRAEKNLFIGVIFLYYFGQQFIYQIFIPSLVGYAFIWDR